jgi:hypothetical protein
MRSSASQVPIPAETPSKAAGKPAVSDLIIAVRWADLAAFQSQSVMAAWAQELSIDVWFFRSLRAFPMPALKPIDALRRGARATPTC